VVWCGVIQQSQPCHATVAFDGDPELAAEKDERQRTKNESQEATTRLRAVWV